MPKIRYQKKSFRADSLEVIERANAIIEVYAAQGFDLTLRQLFYQFVSRGLIPNKDSEYKRLGSIVNDARLAGLIDWEHITDRTRNLRGNAHWEQPQDIMRSAAYSFAIDKWADQDYRPEVWIEKDALVGVIEGVCKTLDIDFFSCRGYTSQSEMWSAGRRLERYCLEGQTPVVIHLGDHDPSGIDMTRDIGDRLDLFSGAAEVKRIALNIEQIELYNPPPNPAKVTDSRATSYISRYGSSSWELDALEPTVIAAAIEQTVLSYRDDARWEAAVRLEEQHRKDLQKAAQRWEEVVGVLNREG
jgi:hypothetical protein